MATEIERKFLPKDSTWRDHVENSKELVQAYLINRPNRSLRIRREGEVYVVCYKGKARGLSVPEYEVLVWPWVGKALRFLGRKQTVQKTRHYVTYQGKCFEIDEFTGALHDLVVIETELESESEQISLPPWIGLEVTHDFRYKNAVLAKHGKLQT